MIGVVSLRDALLAAEDAGLDLVEVAPQAEPPVCKILDYGKFKYEAQKKANEARKKQKIIEVKEIKLRPNIDDNDYDVKMRSARRFLEEGDKVKVTLRFRGREMTHQDLGMNVLVRVRDELTELAKVEQMPKLEVPAAAAAKKPRIFELRRYESHSDKAAIRKLEMFNKGGEIPIFRRAGLAPVFFGEALVGEQLPSLTYMLTHESMAARDEGWAKFNSDPEWRKLSANPYYAETVSSVTDIILRPTGFSQI